MSRKRHTERFLQSLELRELDLNHVQDISKLHYDELSWSFNGKFGLDHIVELYEAIAKSPHMFGYVIFVRGVLVGFATGTTDTVATRRMVQEIFKRKRLKTFGVLLRNPTFIIGVLESMWLVPMIFRRYGTSAEWLTFVTNTAQPSISPYVAIRLIDAVHNQYSELGVKCFLAQGVKRNPRAIALYEKLNWSIVSRLLVHNIYRYDPNGPKSIDSISSED